jgi:hypothetical protein
MRLRGDAYELVGISETLQIITELYNQSVGALKNQACLVLADLKYDYDSCLQKMASSASSDDEKRIAVKRLEGLSRAVMGLEKQFIRDPKMYLLRTARSDAPGDIADLLLVLARHKDPSIRSVACRELRTDFPDRQQVCTN